MEFFTFDNAYVCRLRDGDPDTEKHFVAYFLQLLSIKLRSRRLPPDTVGELRQETFSRILVALRKEGGIREPSRLGAFVNSICTNVLYEYFRASKRSQPLEESHLESPDQVVDLEGMLVTKESIHSVREVLAALPDRDQQVLRAVFLEERDKDEVCRDFKIDREYLRVLVHRAKDRFRALYEKRGGGLSH